MDKILKCSLLSLAIFMSASSYASDCGVKIGAANALILEDGTVDSEDDYLALSLAALRECKVAAKAWPSLSKSMTLGVRACNEAARQGQSKMYKARCYLIVADLAAWITGR